MVTIIRCKNDIHAYYNKCIKKKKTPRKVTRNQTCYTEKGCASRALKKSNSKRKNFQCQTAWMSNWPEPDLLPEDNHCDSHNSVKPALHQVTFQAMSLS